MEGRSSAGFLDSDFRKVRQHQVPGRRLRVHPLRHLIKVSVSLCHFTVSHIIRFNISGSHINTRERKQVKLTLVGQSIESRACKILSFQHVIDT